MLVIRRILRESNYPHFPLQPKRKVTHRNHFDPVESYHHEGEHRPARVHVWRGIGSVLRTSTSRSWARPGVKGMSAQPRRRPAFNEHPSGVIQKED
ncbi:hypothetical protein TNCV_487591 [Trichonephila clavipes]|nr:hypothetical protein TNCV_487591 [Trichonephila clavipes]